MNAAEWTAIGSIVLSALNLAVRPVVEAVGRRSDRRAKAVVEQGFCSCGHHAVAHLRRKGCDTFPHGCGCKQFTALIGATSLRKAEA